MLNLSTMFGRFIFCANLCFLTGATFLEAGNAHLNTKGITADYDNSKLKAAGVLPYAVDNGTVYVLLGRQCISTIPSSGMWKGFGGKRDPGETLFVTALREAKEESRAVLGEDSPIYDPANFPLSESIGTEHYNCKYFQLLAPVAFDPTVPARFQEIFSSDPHVMEKLELRWVPFENVYAAIKEVHQASLDQKCLPMKINRIVHVKVGNEFLPLALDFVETLAANYRNPNDSIHALAKNQTPITQTMSTDLDIVEVK